MCNQPVERKMGFKVQKWLSDHDTYRFLVSKGFKVMEDLDGVERKCVLREVFKKNDLNFVIDFKANGLETINIDPLMSCLDSLEVDNINIVKFLVENGCPVNVPNEEPFIKAHGPAMRGLVHLFSGYSKRSPLVAAIQSNLPTVAEYLLHQGATLGSKVLEAIGHSHNVAFLELLKKINIDLKEKGMTVLKAAVKIKQKIDVKKFVDTGMIEMIKALLQSGIDVSAKLENGSHCGHVFVENCSYSHVSESTKAEVLDTLLAHGLDINSTDNMERTMLHLCPWSDTDLIKLLLSRGADPNRPNSSGQSATFTKMEDVASQGNIRNFVETMVLFSQYRADFNTMDKSESTILSTLLSYSWRLEGPDPVQCLLVTVEISALPSDECVRDKLSWKYRPWILTLVQSGCSNSSLLRMLSPKLLKTDVDSFFACVDPRIQKKLSSAFTQNESKGYAKVYRLEDLTVYTIRKQILEASGNKSIIPQAKKLPLPSNLIQMVTMRRFKLRNMSHLELLESSNDSEPDPEDFESSDSDVPHGCCYYD